MGVEADLQTAFGLLEIAPAIFWELTLAEWQMWVGGHTERQRNSMRKLAWLSGNQLVAAGAKPEQVTVAKLPGEKEPRRRGATVRPWVEVSDAPRAGAPSFADVARAAIEKQKQHALEAQELRAARVAEMSEEAVKAEEEKQLAKARAAARRRAKKEGDRCRAILLW